MTPFFWHKEEGSLRVIDGTLLVDFARTEYLGQKAAFGGVAQQVKRMFHQELLD